MSKLNVRRSKSRLATTACSFTARANERPRQWNRP
jgi:hypothetical protein